MKNGYTMGSYTYGSPLSFNGKDRTHLKAGFIHANFVNGKGELTLFSFALD